MKKNWTMIKGQYRRHKTEREAIAYMRNVKDGQENIKTADTGIDPEAGFYTDEQIAELLNENC